MGLGLVVLIAAGWWMMDRLFPTTNLPPFGKLTPQQAYELIQGSNENSDLVILDVRTAQEHAQGYLSSQGKDSLNLDFYMADFQSQLAALDQDRTYLVY